MAMENILFPAAADYLNLPAATYNFKVTPAEASESVVINVDVPLVNMDYTLLAVSELAEIEPAAHR